MEQNTLKLSDKLNHEDLLTFEVKKPGFRTDIRGYNELGEEVFRTENSIVLGGALFVLEKVFGVASPLTVDYLNNIMGIATSGPAVTDIYPKDNVVCLFGVGTGGSGDSITSVVDVKFQERELVSMIPLRASTTALAAADASKYWFKKVLTGGQTAYYLKNFETTPSIKVLWKNGVGDEDGTAVDSNVYQSTSTTPIETFIELVLKVTKDDCREWFSINGNIDQARVNTIGLFTGVKSTLADGSTDYKEVKLFSKLNINNEMLTLAKDLTIVYRIYTS
jgi:hypothetical protein